MLHITESQKVLREETVRMTCLTKNIISKLNLVNENSNLSKEIGIFVKQVPEFKVLAKDGESLKKLLRKVCTGEKDPREAAKTLARAVVELKILSDALKGIK